MLNKLLSFIKEHNMLVPGDHLVCAVSGGADSVALLFAMHLLSNQLQITLSCAHFNHNLRGEESDRDAEFVRKFCDQYDIPFQLGSQKVTAGKKGLEAAARDARYGFLKSLPGKVATAHTADDNLETVLMHLVRGTDLKGLGGITPVSGTLIRPMLMITREEVMAFIGEYHLSYVDDSSNRTDDFLRNRLRHHVVPLLKQENPKLSKNTSLLALRLREDEQALASLEQKQLPAVSELQQMMPALRRRALHRFLEDSGVIEPEAAHVEMAEKLVLSDKPSAKANFPGNICIARNYDVLEVLDQSQKLDTLELPCPGSLELPEWNMRIVCEPAQEIVRQKERFCVQLQGKAYVRSRQPGDAITLDGGSKSLKKLFIDQKIPAKERGSIPVLCDEEGIFAVFGIGADVKRLAEHLPAMQIRFEMI